MQTSSPVKMPDDNAMEGAEAQPEGGHVETPPAGEEVIPESRGTDYDTARDTSGTTEANEATETTDANETKGNGASNGADDNETNDNATNANGDAKDGLPKEESDNEAEHKADGKSDEEGESDHSSESASDSGSEDSDSDLDSDSDTEETEPRLKYSRLVGLPKTIFTRDPVSATLVNDNIVIIATHSGLIHLFRPNIELIRSFKAHSASIMSLSTDGTYFASASLDGRVVIGSIADPQDIAASDFKRPVHAVALDPNYASSKTFVSGGTAGNVILSEKGWLQARSDTNICTSDSTIVMLKWIGDVVLWINDDGITIWNHVTKQQVLQVPKPENISRADLYHPRMHLSDGHDRIYLAWADHIWILEVTQEKKERSKKPKKEPINDGMSIFSRRILSTSASSTKSPQPETTVAVVTKFRVDSLLCGISTFGADMLMLLCYTKGERRAQRPELRLIDAASGEEVSSDELPLNGFESLGPNDYQLQTHAPVEKDAKAQYYIISARDGVVARERDLTDHVQWLVEHEKYESAWVTCESIYGTVERKNLGIEWVESHVRDELWREAGAALSLVLTAFLGTIDPQDTYKHSIWTEDWSNWAFIFCKSNNYELLANYLPDQLQASVYDEYLRHYLHDDAEKFGFYMKKWQGLFSEGIEQSLVEEIDSSEDEKKISALKLALAELHIADGKYKPALALLLELRDERCLDLIEAHHLLSDISPKDIPSLLTIGAGKDTASTLASLEKASAEEIQTTLKRTTEMLVEGYHELPPKTVLSALPESSPLAYVYLHSLNQADSFAAREYGNQLMALYAKYDHVALSAFLKSNNNYDIGSAVDLCRADKSLTPDLVYLLGKVGRNMEALRLIIDELQDPYQAISFSLKQKDSELWNFLVDYSIDKPLFLKALLENIAMAQTPTYKLIERIPPNLEIPGLKSCLLNIFTENELQLSVTRGAHEIITNECHRETDGLGRLRMGGVAFDGVGLDELAVKNLDGESVEVDKLPSWQAHDGSFASKLAHVSFLQQQAGR
ncbi:Vacuolar protein sorting-associated protein 41 [Yarrowia sp. B02]|nr:Vacuolar protein sorting-associated protein 41 [Yarrowia sp. B02]